MRLRILNENNENFILVNEGFAGSVGKLLNNLSAWGEKHPNLYSTLAGMMGATTGAIASTITGGSIKTSALVSGLLSGGGTKLYTYLREKGMEEDDAKQVTTILQNKQEQENSNAYKKSLDGKSVNNIDIDNKKITSWNKKSLDGKSVNKKDIEDKVKKLKKLKQELDQQPSSPQFQSNYSFLNNTIIYENGERLNNMKEISIYTNMLDFECFKNNFKKKVVLFGNTNKEQLIKIANNEFNDDIYICIGVRGCEYDDDKYDIHNIKELQNYEEKDNCIPLLMVYKNDINNNILNNICMILSFINLYNSDY